MAAAANRATGKASITYFIFDPFGLGRIDAKGRIAFALASRCQPPEPVLE
jgi:hypothetical protein